MSPERRRRPLSRTSARLANAAVVGVALILLTAACGHQPAAPVAIAPPPPRPPAGAPPAPQPTADGPCSYLSAAAVQAANGERVRAVRVSTPGPQQPYPACFFLTTGGDVQLRSWVVVATPQVAHATVDAAAPVGTSDLAQLPGGWSGGSAPSADGAVFAVSRAGTAVVVTTNQHQTISARRIASQVIAALNL
ncbi:MAG: DUF2020 domain-containing protein [Pseudonocardiaceae bacterium]